MALNLPVDDVSERVASLMMESAMDDDATAEQEAEIDANRFWPAEQKEKYKEELRVQKDAALESAKSQLQDMLRRQVERLNSIIETTDSKLKSLQTSAVGISASAATAIVPQPAAPGAQATALAGLVAQKSALRAALADCDALINEAQGLIVSAGLALIGLDVTVGAALAAFGVLVRSIGMVLSALPF